MSENYEQMSLVSMLHTTYPGFIYDVNPYAGMKHSKIQAIKAKNLGLQTGVPDFFFPTLHLYIELKAGKGRLSLAQRVRHIALREHGYEVLTCYGALEAFAAVKLRMEKC